MAKNDSKIFHWVIKERIAELKLILGHNPLKNDVRMRLNEVQSIYSRFYDLKKKKMEESNGKD